MLNINVGILGHVDSGKTSLAKALSAVSSTACFDKSPQSQARGITLDLGFSAYFVDVSSHAKFAAAGISAVQVTLVDCPGHASLIRTIMGGAQIIDMMLLVVDVTKGIQTQTAECLVVGEMLARHLVVVLNKVDMAQGATPAEKTKTVEKMEKRLRGVMAQTRWPTAPIVAVAAAPSSAGAAAAEPAGAAEPAAAEGAALPPAAAGPVNVEAVTARILELLDVALAARRPPAAAFLMYVDHCFAVKGQGTVLTGTVLDGTVKVGDEITLPDYQQQRRVKGLQMFRKPVQQAGQGDRIGLCITQFDASLMERGIVCGKEAHVVSTAACIAEVKKVRFHKLAVEPSHKYHITVGHSTVMGVLKFFSCPSALVPPQGITDFFASGLTFDYVDALPDDSAQQFQALLPSDPPGKCAALQGGAVRYFAVVLLESPITTVPGATLIASRLDADIHQNMCRLAIQGTAMQLLDGQAPDKWRSLPVVKHKARPVAIDRVIDSFTCIAKGLKGPPAGGGGDGTAAAAAEQQLDVQKFVGMKVAYHYRVSAASQKKAAKPEGGAGGKAVHVDPATAAAAAASASPSASAAKAAPAQPAAASAAAAASASAPLAHPLFPDVEGIIEGTFGKTGKVRIVFKGPVFDRGGSNTAAAAGAGGGSDAAGGKKKGPAAAAAAPPAPTGKQPPVQPPQPDGAASAQPPAPAAGSKAPGGTPPAAPAAPKAPLGDILLRYRRNPFALHSPMIQ